MTLTASSTVSPSTTFMSTLTTYSRLHIKHKHRAIYAMWPACNQMKCFDLQMMAADIPVDCIIMQHHSVHGGLPLYCGTPTKGQTCECQQQGAVEASDSQQHYHTHLLSYPGSTVGLSSTPPPGPGLAFTLVCLINCLVEARPKLERLLESSRRRSRTRL